MTKEFEEKYFKRLEDIGLKEYFIMKTKLFFYPLKQKWFWYVSLGLVGVAFIGVWMGF